MLQPATISGDAQGTRYDDIELSIVIPCLNEAETLGACIEKAQNAIREQGLRAEVIIADNGSTDGSPTLAAGLGVRVVRVDARGYGEALMGGIAAARGRFIIMGDGDDSYDFLEIGRFVEKLREGFDLVQGCRLPSGGGRVMPGAMPLLHRWLGNPLFSLLARWWFRAPLHDVYCGLRGFRKDLYERLDLRCTGMEFAIEMVLKSSLYGARIAETAVTLHPDGRTVHPPHLRMFRDGWRTLRFFLLFSPRWLFLVPGLLCVGIGLLGYVLALPGVRFGNVILDAHTLLFSSLAMLCGYQVILFALFAKTFALSEGLLPDDPRMTRFFRLVTLERGVLAGLLGILVGLGLLMGAVIQWRDAGFGRLDYSRTMRWVIPGATLTALGFQTVLASFLTGVLRLRRR